MDPEQRQALITELVRQGHSFFDIRNLSDAELVNLTRGPGLFDINELNLFGIDIGLGGGGRLEQPEDQRTLEETFTRLSTGERNPTRSVLNQVANQLRELVENDPYTAGFTAAEKDRVVNEGVTAFINGAASATEAFSQVISNDQELLHQYNTASVEDLSGLPADRAAQFARQFPDSQLAPIVAGPGGNRIWDPNSQATLIWDDELGWRIPTDADDATEEQEIPQGAAGDAWAAGLDPTQIPLAIAATADGAYPDLTSAAAALSGGDTPDISVTAAIGIQHALGLGDVFSPEDISRIMAENPGLLVDVAREQRLRREEEGRGRGGPRVPTAEEQARTGLLTEQTEGQRLQNEATQRLLEGDLNLVPLDEASGLFIDTVTGQVVDQQGRRIDAERFALEQELGRGGLDVSRGRLDLDTELGRGNLLARQSELVENARQFDVGLSENIRQANLLDARERNKLAETARQFDAGLAEDIRQFDITIAEDARQFNLQENRLTREGLQRLGVDLGRLNLEQQQQVTDILRNPADFLSRAFRTRGEVSPFPEITQADLINQLTSEFARSRRMTNQEIAAHRLAEPSYRPGGVRGGGGGGRGAAAADDPVVPPPFDTNTNGDTAPGGTGNDDLLDLSNIHTFTGPDGETFQVYETPEGYFEYFSPSTNETRYLTRDQFLNQLSIDQGRTPQVEGATQVRLMTPTPPPPPPPPPSEDMSDVGGVGFGNGSNGRFNPDLLYVDEVLGLLGNGSNTRFNPGTPYVDETLGLPGHAHGGTTRAGRLLVGDEPSGRPNDTEEVIINPTNAPIVVVPNDRIRRRPRQRFQSGTLGSRLFDIVGNQQTTQGQLIGLAQQAQPPAISRLLGDENIGNLSFRRPVFSPTRTSRLTPDERTALRTRLAAENESLEDILFETANRFLGQRAAPRLRLGQVR